MTPETEYEIGFRVGYGNGARDTACVVFGLMGMAEAIRMRPFSVVAWCGANVGCLGGCSLPPGHAGPHECGTCG